MARSFKALVSWMAVFTIAAVTTQPAPSLAALSRVSKVHRITKTKPGVKIGFTTIPRILTLHRTHPRYVEWTKLATDAKRQGRTLNVGFEPASGALTNLKLADRVE